MENVKNDTVLLIPDIHGREFWKEGVEKRKPGETIIFLGDYTDPYPHEGITHEVIPGMLSEIIKTPNSIFLLGNHDLSYIYPNDSPEVRKDHDKERLGWIEKFFEDHHLDFSLCHILEREDGTNVIFSHAGLLKELYHHGKYTPTQVAEKFNEWWKKKDPILATELFKIGWLRGGYDEVGSLVWADVREHMARRNIFWSNDYQVFGHTMLKDGNIVKLSSFACIDCKRPVRMWWNKETPEFEVL